MSFDLDKMQAVIEIGEVIRLQNDALERLVAFRKARPNMMMPNLAKMVEENLKENVQVLYKELNNMHKPPEKQTRYICKECHMAFLSPLPGGICDECRARQGSSQPRAYVPFVDTETEEMDEIAVDNARASDTHVTPTSTDDEQAVANAYESAVGTPDEMEVEKLMAQPKAINLPSDDTEIYMADGEEVSEIMATLPIEKNEPIEPVGLVQPPEAGDPLSADDVTPQDVPASDVDDGPEDRNI